MYRRDLLAMAAASLGMIGVAGCLGSDSTADDGGTPTRSAPSATPTRAPSTSTDGGGTPTRTPVPFPDACQPLPDVDGLPARPTELTAESIRSYVTEFERVYAVATRSEYGGIANLRVIESETLGERYRLLLEVEGAPATTTGPRREHTDADADRCVRPQGPVSGSGRPDGTGVAHVPRRGDPLQ